MNPWELRSGEPFGAGAGGRTLRATLPDGTPAVLKHVHPHRESEHEAEALERWDGEGAVRLLVGLPPKQGEPVLVNQDLHGDNVLSAQREPWLLIDPKPLVAEREFVLAPIIRSAELGHTRKDVQYRLDRLTAEPHGCGRSAPPSPGRSAGHRPTST